MCRRHLFRLLLLLVTAVIGGGRMSGKLGINYGRLGDDLPTPATSLDVIRSINAGGVKTYDADPAVLSVLADSNLPLSIMVPNQLIPSLAANVTSAAIWVETHLLPFLPKARVRYLLVGNEVLSDYSVKNSTWPCIVPALVNVHKVLVSRSIHSIKLGTTLAMDALGVSFPPSSSEFRRDIAVPVVLPLLKFLQRTRSFYFVDAYPYFVWSDNPTSVSLDYALLDPEKAKPFVDPNTRLIYRNMLEQQLDAVAFAMDKLGVHGVRISIAETGWPNAGDYDQIGANVRNAATYNRNLAKWVSSGARTPARPAPNKSLAFVFALYDENRKGGPGTERHWGVFYPNCSAVYDVDLSARTLESSWKPLPAADNDRPYKGKIWCVATEGHRNATSLAEAVAYACAQGNHTCDAIRPGGRCWTGYSAVARASYAFNDYWQQFRSSGATCFFNGLAAQTIKDPRAPRASTEGSWTLAASKEGRWTLAASVLISAPSRFRC